MDFSSAEVDAIADLVSAINAGDLARMLSHFAKDAVVNDQLAEYRGADALEVWARRDVIGASLSIDRIALRHARGFSVMLGHVDGNFDKRGLPTPLVYKFYFVLNSGQVALLIILREET